MKEENIIMMTNDPEIYRPTSKLRYVEEEHFWISDDQSYPRRMSGTSTTLQQMYIRLVDNGEFWFDVPTVNIKDV